MSDTKQLPLQKLHASAGAKFGEFAGWSMPLSYQPGVMKEHLHTRTHAGLFDISHMGHIDISGPQSALLVGRLCPLDPASLFNGQAKYSFLLNEEATILDDVIVTRLPDDRFRVVINAGRAANDIEHVQKVAQEFEAGVEVLDMVFLALQGPAAEAVLKDIGITHLPSAFMTAVEVDRQFLIARSGYTGEDGFEIALPGDRAAELADRLLADDRVMWIGLAARDSLRLEAGLCLYGQDIDESTTPLDAKLMWAIPKSIRQGGRFIGAAALSEALEHGAEQARVGLKPLGRQPVRNGELFNAEGSVVGRVTSGGFGPSANHPVAMGYVSQPCAGIDTELVAQVRGKPVPMVVCKLPFVEHNYKRER